MLIEWINYGYGENCEDEYKEESGFGENMMDS